MYSIQQFYKDKVNEIQKDRTKEHVVVSVLQLFQTEYIKILKFSEKVFQDCEMQRVRQFVLECITEDLRRLYIRLINRELVDTLNNVISEDNSQNGLQAMRALSEIIQSITNLDDKLQRERGMNVNVDFERRILIDVINDIVPSWENIVKQLAKKLGFLRNLRVNFFVAGEKDQWSHFSIERRTSQIGEGLLLRSKFDLKTYDELTGIVVSLILIQLKMIQKDEDMRVLITNFCEHFKNMMVIGIEGIGEVDFEYTQQICNRKFHEELVMTQWKIFRYFKQIYDNYNILDPENRPQIMPNEFVRVIVQYTIRVPDEYVESKIFLLKEISKVIQGLQSYTLLAEEFRIFANLNSFIQLDAMVSNKQRADILQNYVQIYKSIFSIYFPEELRMNPRLANSNYNSHKTSKISQYSEDNIYDMIEKIVDNLIIILFDNAIHLNSHELALKLLIQLIQRFYITDNEYFKRTEPPSYQHCIKKNNVIEYILKFIASKYKDINYNFAAILDFQKKIFIKSQSELTKNTQKNANANIPALPQSKNASKLNSDSKISIPKRPIIVNPIVNYGKTFLSNITIIPIFFMGGWGVDSAPNNYYEQFNNIILFDLHDHKIFWF